MLLKAPFKFAPRSDLSLDLLQHSSRSGKTENEKAIACPCKTWIVRPHGAPICLDGQFVCTTDSNRPQFKGNHNRRPVCFVGDDERNSRGIDTAGALSRNQGLAGRRDFHFTKLDQRCRFRHFFEVLFCPQSRQIHCSRDVLRIQRKGCKKPCFHIECQKGLRQKTTGQSRISGSLC